MPPNQNELLLAADYCLLFLGREDDVVVEGGWGRTATLQVRADKRRRGEESDEVEGRRP